MDTGQCVNCGDCCSVPCGYGEWNEEKTRCKYLVPKNKEKNYETFLCGRYDFIIKQPGAEYYPAFGAGCCRGLFNTKRERLLRRIKT